MMENTGMQFSCPMPEVDFDVITIGHGSGGQLTNNLIDRLIMTLFSNKSLDQRHDGAVMEINGKIAFSTDSFVVSPVFFPGGNIGDLAINGTMNDLAMCGAIPKYLSLSLILEEGLPVTELWNILESVWKISKMYGVDIVTGDTKVVERGKGDKIFINTTGIGLVLEQASIGVEFIREGDVVIVSGPIATHGMAIMSVREGLEFETDLCSDTAYIGDVAIGLIETFGDQVRFLRDPTRGGLATVLNEIAQTAKMSIELEESSIPVLPQARSACEMLGLDPLYVANEGIFVAIVAAEAAKAALEEMRKNEKCSGATIVGKVSKNFPGKVIVNSGLGGKRVVSMLIGEHLPRIC